MSDLHRMPLMGHDLPLAVSARVPDTAYPDFTRTRAKARVYRTETVAGHGWRWKHLCPWRGNTVITSYPLESWRAAYVAALRHLEDCP